MSDRAAAADACHKTAGPAILKDEAEIMGRGNADDIANRRFKEILEVVGAQALER